MTLGFNDQFYGRFPEGEEGVLALVAALADATDEEVSVYTSGLSGLLSGQKNRLSLWCERVLRKAESSRLLGITIDAAITSKNFDDMQVSDLFDTCLQFYRSGKIDVLKLEDNWVSLIDAMPIKNDHAYKNPFYALGRGLSISQDVDLTTNQMPRLDSSLSRHAANYDAVYYQDNVVRPVSWMVNELNLPQTFRQVSGWYNHIKDPDGISFLIEAVATQGGITAEQLMIIADGYGVSHLGASFEQVIMYLPKLSSIKLFVDTFSEKDLFTEKSLKKLLVANKKNCCLSIYAILSDPSFEHSDLPIFSNFTLKATPVIYKTLSVNDTERRTALRKLNVSMGKLDDIWRCELEFYKRHLKPDLQKLAGDDPAAVLAALKVSRPTEYKVALKAINEIGIAQIGMGLAGASREFVDDFISSVNMDLKQKRDFMKIFPQARAQILEEDLGM